MSSLWLPLISAVLKENAIEEGIHVPAGSYCMMLRKQALKNATTTLVVNGYLTDFRRLNLVKYISADFALPWEKPGGGLNSYRSDYCSETKRYIVSKSDQQLDWQKLSRRIEKELADKEAARKADREQEKALKKAAKKTKYEQEQAFKTTAGQKVTTEDSLRMEFLPLTPEAILNTTVMNPNTSLYNSTCSSDKPPPTNESFLPVEYIEDLLSKPATPEIKASNNSESLLCNGVSHEIFGDSEAFLPLLPQSDSTTNLCKTLNTREEAPSHSIGSPGNNEALGNNDSKYDAKLFCLPHIDLTHPCNKPNSWDEVSDTCAPESKRILEATFTDIQNEKAPEESFQDDGKDSPTDKPSPTSTKISDPNQALSDGLPTSPLSAFISKNVEEKPVEDISCGPSTSSKILSVSNPSENYTSGIQPTRPKNQALGLLPKEKQLLTKVRLPALVADEERETSHNPPLMGTRAEGLVLQIAENKPTEDFLPNTSTSGKIPSLLSLSEKFTPEVSPKETEFSPMVFSLPIGPKNRALDLAVSKQKQKPETKIPAFVADNELETSHKPPLMGLKAESPFLKVAETKPEEDSLPEASTSSKTPSVSTPSEEFAPGILPDVTNISPVMVSLPLRAKEQTPGLIVQDLTVHNDEQKPEIKFPALVTEETLELSPCSASVGPKAELSVLAVVEEKQGINTPAGDGHEIAHTGGILAEAVEGSFENSTPDIAAALNGQETGNCPPEIILIGGTPSMANSLGEWVVSSNKTVYNNLPSASTILLYFSSAICISFTLLHSFAKLVKKNEGRVKEMVSYIRSNPWLLLLVLITGTERLVLGAIAGIGIVLMAGSYDWGQGLEETRHEGV